jgi:leucyl-tRNA synthetase
MIQIEGKKMSKTRGNFVTWKAALEKHGADALRLALVLTADGMDDADWRERSAEDLRQKIDSVVPFAKKTLKSSVKREKDVLDLWLYSTLNRRIATVTAAMEEMKVRRASATAFLDTWNDVRRYLYRCKKPRRETLIDVFSAWARLIAPFAPFVAEDLHHELGGKGLVSQADWPSLRDFPVDEGAELAETVVDRVVEDSRRVLKVVRDKKTRLNVYVASDEARVYFGELVAARQRKENIGAVMKKHSSLKIPPDRIFKLVYELGDDLVARLTASRRFDEYSVLSSAAPYLSRELGMEVRVQKAGGKETPDPASRAKDALPLKPALFLE